MTLREKLEEAGFSTRSYSGRGMYGVECLGALADTREAIYSVISAKDIRAARTDSMGFDVVVYWPQVPYEEGGR